MRTLAPRMIKIFKKTFKPLREDNTKNIYLYIRCSKPHVICIQIPFYNKKIVYISKSPKTFFNKEILSLKFLSTHGSNNFIWLNLTNYTAKLKRHGISLKYVKENKGKMKLRVHIMNAKIVNV